jgi:subfamily B ATP-binding cassette protein MsbA
MKLLKIIGWTLLGLGITVGATFSLWYNYPRLNLSFFLSGSGNPLISATYTNSDNENFTTVLYSQLSQTPEVYTLSLDATSVSSLNLEFKDYEGTISISDVFLNGKHFTGILPTGDDIRILNSGNDTLSFHTNGNAGVQICTDCNLLPEKQFKPMALTLCIFVYVFFAGLIIAAYLFRQKLQEKLLTIYSFKNYALIYPYFKPYWFRALLAIVITIPVGSMDAVIAWSLKPFMDVVLVEKQTGWTMYIPLMIIVFSVFQALFTYIATYMNTWVGNKISLDIKRRLFKKLLHRDAAFFDKSNSGEILFRFNNDAESACSGLLNSMKMFSIRFFSSLSLIVVLFFNSWQLAIIAVVVMFGALYPLTRVRKRLKKVVCKDANVLASVLTHYNEAFSGNRIVTAYNLFDFRNKKFKNTINELFNLSLQMIKKTGIISPIMHIISSLGIAFVIWYGSYLIVSHQITVGNFASFITSLVMLYNPIKSIGNNYNSLIFSMMAIDRVFSVLNSTDNIKNRSDCKKLQNCKGNITYKNVSFEYVSGKPVLNNINLKIKSGQTVALVGNSGGGKTTISSLLPRFYDVTKGSVRIDGEDIKNIDIQNLRDNISIVFQDNFLFGGTIRDNIVFGRKDISEEQLNSALHAACLDEFIATLENGLDTVIGERGVMLSGGQKQRIAIARAFIKNAPILILDEATSALDNKSEAVVQQAIENLMKDRTVMVIAHRLSTVRNADNIIVINDGKIVEQGNHEELLKKDGAYAALYKTQLA